MKTCKRLLKATDSVKMELLESVESSSTQVQSPGRHFMNTGHENFQSIIFVSFVRKCNSASLLDVK